MRTAASATAHAGLTVMITWPHLMALQQHPVFQNEVVGIVLLPLAPQLAQLAPSRMKYFTRITSLTPVTEATTAAGMDELRHVRCGNSKQHLSEDGMEVVEWWNQLRKVLPSLSPSDMQVCEIGHLGNSQEDAA